MIQRGSVMEADVDRFHLVKHHLLNEQDGVDKVIMYAERRTLMTFITAGVSEGRYTAPGYYGKDTAQTYIKPVPKGQLTKNLAWKYKVMGRIQKASVIVGSYGVPTAGTATTAGSFMLKMKTDELKPGQNCVFYNGKHARVQSHPQRTAGGFIYRFSNNKPGETFDYTTWVAAQPGAKTLFASYSTYGERSLRGYGRVHFGEMSINHMTTQRKGFSISGDADVEDVIWYSIADQKGFVFEAEAQIRAQMHLEDDYEKFWGESTYKDANGNLLDFPIQVDDETGQPIHKGDGWYEQIKGCNDLEASGSDGLPTYDDYVEMVKTILKNDDEARGEKLIYAISGTDGFMHAHDVILAHDSQIYNLNMDMKGTDFKTSGFHFNKLRVAGTEVVFVRNPMMDDKERFPRRMSNGKLAMACTTYIMDQTPDQTGRPNIEIRTRGNKGINRNMVYAWKEGMTGRGKADEFVDAREFQMLKQDMLVCYNTKTQGIIFPNSSFM